MLLITAIRIVKNIKCHKKVTSNKMIKLSTFKIHHYSTNLNLTKINIVASTSQKKNHMKPILKQNFNIWFPPNQRNYSTKKCSDYQIQQNIYQEMKLLV